MRFLEVVGVLVLVCVCLSDAAANSEPGEDFKRETRHRTRTYGNYVPYYNGEFMTVDMLFRELMEKVQSMQDDMDGLNVRVSYLETMGGGSGDHPASSMDPSMYSSSSTYMYEGAGNTFTSTDSSGSYSYDGSASQRSYNVLSEQEPLESILERLRQSLKKRQLTKA